MDRIGWGSMPKTKLSHNNATTSPHPPGPSYSVNRNPHLHTPKLDAGFRTGVIRTIRYALTSDRASPGSKGWLGKDAASNALQKGGMAGISKGWCLPCLRMRRGSPLREAAVAQSLLDGRVWLRAAMVFGRLYRPC